MTIAKDFASKLAVAFVAGAMVFAAYAPAANAQSTEDLQQMINDLLSQVATLQSQLGQDGGGTAAVAPTVCPYTWTRDLSQGSTGMDVMKLQQFLNADPDTRVAAAGQIGSAGMETEYYGPATAAAVSKMQVKYRADVLSPLNLVNPTGYFGSGSRDKANSLCVAAPVTTPDDEDEDEMEDEDEEEEEEDEFELGGQATLDDMELDDGETTIEEGDEDVVIGEITVEFRNGDAEISRLDVALDGDQSAGAYPWDAFETISLWVDGDKIAEVDADRENDYLDEDDGSLRFANLGLIAEEDEEMEILVGATVQNVVRSEERTAWTLTVPSMRFFDADGVAETLPDPTSGDTAEFDLEVAGADEELDISRSSSNPDATDIVVDTDNDTNDVTIMTADLEAEDNDIELDRVVVLVETDGASTTAVVDDAYVMIDGQSFKAETIGGTPGDATSITSSRSVFDNADEQGVWYVFDIDGDVVLDEDDEVEMDVVVDFKDTDDGNRYSNGQTIKASINTAVKSYWQAEGAEDLVAPGDFSGTAIGETHTLVAEGLLLPRDGVTTNTDTQGQDDTTGIFTIDFEVTAVEGDYYIAENATSAAATTSGGVKYTVDTGASAPTSESGVISSTADQDSGTDAYIVREGETETFTLTVTVDASSTAQHRVLLDAVYFSTNLDGLGPDGVGTDDTFETYTPTPAQDFRTGYENING